MTASIKEQVLDDMKTAMRAQDKARLSTIRLIMAALKQREIDERITLTNEHTLAILNKMVKQRRDSINQFEAGGRDDLVKKEAAEITVIQQYLPAQLSEAQINQAITEAIKAASANSPKEMGKVMSLLKAKLQGKADMAVVSAQVKAQLAE